MCRCLCLCRPPEVGRLSADIEQEAPTMSEERPAIRVRGDQTWQERAACAVAAEVVTDPDLFFPGRGANDERIQLAKGICSSCAVRATCLEAALECRDAVGVRGGLTVAERRAVRHSFDLRCDSARVTAALAGRDVHLTRPERQELIRWAAASNTSTPLLASVLKISEAHVQKLLRRERRSDVNDSAETVSAGQAARQAAAA
ncbi:WhiB family transcriptional regulator [Streptomyces sp. WG7]|uniref:WhiB family transcriptional regulator n=1 Tax=Streptomyces sp. WG7 TaxID=3417650 RepID=UPI003CE8090E